MKVTDVTRTEKGGWRPEKGETIAGRISDIDIGEAGFGPYPIVELQLDDGTVNVHAFHDMLRRRLKLRGAQIGEDVRITYHGRAGNGATTDAHLYEVVVGAEPRKFDYDALSYGKARAGSSTPAPESRGEDAGDDVPF